MILEELALFLTSQQKRELSDKLARIPSRELTGETIEKTLAEVLQDARQLPKDKRWFDIVQPTKGMEVKTFVARPPLRVGTTVYNVLKRVSKVDTRDAKGNLRNAQQVGDEVIDYLHGTIREHAALKKVPDTHLLSILFRTEDARSYAYWEEPLHFGQKSSYTWVWKGQETLTGYRGNEAIFQWYSRNQKQLFYRWKIPTAADFFQVKPVQTVTLTKEEFENERRKSYLEGFRNGKSGKPSRL